MESDTIFLCDPHHSLRYFRESSYCVINTIFVFRISKHREKSWTIPRRHAKIFGLKGETELEFFSCEVPTQNLIYGFPKREIGDYFYKMLPFLDDSRELAVIHVEARIHLLKTLIFVGEIYIKSHFFSRK